MNTPAMMIIEEPAKESFERLKILERIHGMKATTHIAKAPRPMIHLSSLLRKSTVDLPGVMPGNTPPERFN